MTFRLRAIWNAACRTLLARRVDLSVVAGAAVRALIALALFAGPSLTQVAVATEAASVRTPRQQLADAEAAIRTSERAARVLERELDILGREIAELQESWAADRLEAARCAAGLYAAARRASESPEDRTRADAARSALLLRSLLRQRVEQSTQVRKALAAAQASRSAKAAQREEARRTIRSLEGEHARLESLIAVRSSAAGSTEPKEFEERLRAHAAAAVSLQSRLTPHAKDRLAAPRSFAPIRLPPPPKAPRRAAGSRYDRAFGAKTALPVDGRLARRFGSGSGAGTGAEGITLETQPGASVVAPSFGQVAFAGPFRGYGLLLIVEHRDGYHTLISGLGRIDAHIGDRVAVGDLVGAMPRPEAGRPSLYLELRHNGRPVDPLPWLTAEEGKVSG